MNKQSKILLGLFLLLPILLLFTSPVVLAQVPTQTPFYTPALKTTLLPPVLATQGAMFGASVGVSSGTVWNTVVIGAPLDNTVGQVYVYENTNNNAWNQVASLNRPNPQGGDFFGRSVAIDKQVIVVGAPGVNNSNGAVYIYAYVGGTWTYQTTLTSPSDASQTEFGYAVAVSGNSIIVGAPFDDHGSYVDIGSAYIYTGSGANWTLEQTLGSYYTPPFITPGGQFGSAVDIYGDQVIVGAPNTMGGSFSSYAYPFNRVNGHWYLPNALPGQPDTQFGNSVAIYHDMIVVGSPYFDSIGGTDSGRIDVYKWNAASHNFEAISDSDYQLFGSGHVAGYAVDMYRDVELVGAPNATVEYSAQPKRYGAALLFQPGRVLMRETPPSPGANYGYAVADWNGILVIGAPFENFNGTKGPVGSVYIYTIQGPPWDAASPTPQNYWPTSTFAIPAATQTATQTPSSTPYTPTALPNEAPERNFYQNSTVVLTWNPVSWAEGYDLEISHDSNFNDRLDVANPLPADPLSYTATGLENGTYYWRVRAVRSDGVVGAWSAIEMFIVSEPPPPPPATHTFTPGPQVPTQTYTPSPTSTYTPSPTSNPTLTYIPTFTPSPTPNPTLTFTPTFTPSSTSGPTYTASPTFTPTLTFTPSKTGTITITPTKTPTLTRTPQVTFTRTPTVYPPPTLTGGGCVDGCG